MKEEKRIELTLPYMKWKRYYDNYLTSHNIIAVLNEARNFVMGKQYRQNTLNDMPKPVMNICYELVEKKTAKICEVKPHVIFEADKYDKDLTSVDQFYAFLRKVMKDDAFVRRAAKVGFQDGIAVSVTSFDKDTIGCKSAYRGFLKRMLVKFEDTFWENPYTSDPQDQAYFGYRFDMQISALKNMVEGRNEKEKEEKRKKIVPDDFYSDTDHYSDKSEEDIDSYSCSVYVRFFRVDGEVCVEMSTKYVDIYEHPHALNPKMNEAILSKIKQEYYKNLDEYLAKKEERDSRTPDYNMDAAKRVLFEKAVKSATNEWSKKHGKFYLYPVSVFVPDPIEGQLLGNSAVTRIISDQKLINLNFLYPNLILQYHAMPKWLEKRGALNGQRIDNSPNQVIIDYSPIESPTQWGITRLEPSTAINSNLFESGGGQIKLVRNLNGTDDLVSDTLSASSGYEFSQRMHQANLLLEGAQEQLFSFIIDNANIDLMYCKHYIKSGEVKFFVERDDSYVNLQNRYREMSQMLINSGNASGQQNAPAGDGQMPDELPKAQSLVSKDVEDGMFDGDFFIKIDVEQGIASSQISEAEHYEKIWQYMLSGNVPMDKIEVMLAGDPATSRKTLQKVKNAIELTKISQLEVMRQENAMLRQTNQNLLNQLEDAARGIELQNARVASMKKSMSEQTQEYQAIAKLFQNSGQQMSESEVKSNNARGIAGTSFSKGTPSNE